jgi:hypothetical protein
VNGTENRINNFRIVVFASRLNFKQLPFHQSQVRSALNNKLVHQFVVLKHFLIRKAKAEKQNCNSLLGIHAAGFSSSKMQPLFHAPFAMEK